MLAYLRGEDGAEIVETALRDSGPCLAHAANVCEVYYDFLRDLGEAPAQSAVSDLQSMGLTVREDMDQEFWQQIGAYKAANRVSFADCFALALANRCEDVILTSDHHEFDSLVERDICQINFIR